MPAHVMSPSQCHAGNQTRFSKKRILQKRTYLHPDRYSSSSPRRAASATASARDAAPSFVRIELT